MAIELPDGRRESDDVLEALRLRAVHARESGYAVVDIAAILGVRQAVQELIKQGVGVRLPIRTVGEYLRRWGYTPQKPVRKAYRQDPEAVAAWLKTTDPEIERRAAKEGGEIHWGERTGVRSTCQQSRGHAPPGEAPELTVPGNRFNVNMMATVTNQGKVRWRISTGKRNAALFIVFLTRLIAGATKKVFLIVDHLSVHEAAIGVPWLAAKTDRIEVFSLPKYAPERNPEEYLNSDVKANVNTDGLPKDREKLQGKLHRFMQKLAKLRAGVASYFEHKYITYDAGPELNLT